jgi:hypothetical protein
MIVKINEIIEMEKNKKIRMISKSDSILMMKKLK